MPAIIFKRLGCGWKIFEKKEIDLSTTKPGYENAVDHEDGDYTIRVWPFPDSEYVANFEIYFCIGTDSKTGRHIFGEWDGAQGDIDTPGVVSIVDGHVKWDGCANMDFKTDKCMAHFCGANDLDRFLAAVRSAFRLAALSIPKRDAKLQEIFPSQESSVTNE